MQLQFGVAGIGGDDQDVAGVGLVRGGTVHRDGARTALSADA